MDIAQLLLKSLLKKYESSKAFTQDLPVQRRIQLNFYDGEFKPYDFEDFEQKQYLHHLIFDLKREGLIDYSWVRGEEEHILHRVWLNLDQIDKAYKRAGLVSPKAEAKEVLSAVNDALVMFQEAKTKCGTGIDWIGAALNEMRLVLKEKQRLAPPIPPSKEQALLLITALCKLMDLSLAGTSEIMERLFSIQAYGDSKTFEQQVRTRLASLIRKHLLPELLNHSSSQIDDLNLSDDELLLLAGLIRAPEIFEFSGPVRLQRGSQQVDFGFFQSCSTLSSAELDGLLIDISPLVRRLLFVENRTNFHWLVQHRNHELKDTLLVYHGGCFSPAKGCFFQLLKESVSRADHGPIDVYHWGDIDLGGFYIFNRLRQTFFPQLLPWHMDRSDLIIGLDQAQPINKSYAKRLQALLSDERYDVFHPVIKLALEKGVRLEQEVLLDKL